MDRKDWEYITVQEACKKAGIGGTLLRRLCREGVIESKRQGDAERSPYMVVEKSLYKAMADGKIRKRAPNGKPKNGRTKSKKVIRASKAATVGDSTDATIQAFLTVIMARGLANGMTPKEASYEANTVKRMALDLRDDQG